MIFFEIRWSRCTTRLPCWYWHGLPCHTLSSRFRGYRHVERRQHLLAILGGFILCTLGSTGFFIYFHVLSDFMSFCFSICLPKNVTPPVLQCFFVQTNANRSEYHRLAIPTGQTLDIWWQESKEIGCFFSIFPEAWVSSFSIWAISPWATWQFSREHAEKTCHHVSSLTYGWYGCAFLVQMVGGWIPWCQLSGDSFSQEIYLGIFCSCKRTSDQNRQKNPVQPRSDGLILHRSISPSCGHSLGHLLLQGVVLPCWCPTQKEKQVLLKLLNNGFRWPFSAVGCASFTMLFFGK